MTNSDDFEKKTQEELSALIDGESPHGCDPLLINDQQAAARLKLWARFHLISDVLHRREPNLALGENVSAGVFAAINKDSRK